MSRSGSQLFQSVMRGIFSIFYNKKFLSGYYFAEKRIGWYWAYKGIHNRLFDYGTRKVPWPIHPRTVVSGANNITFDQSSLNVFQTPGCYWQAYGAEIYIGKNCYVAPNVGIITTNHDVVDPSNHTKGKPVTISDNCWIGMNAVVLPGVFLGPHVTVAAGAVVTKSFPQGFVVVAGVPAKIIKVIKLDKSKEETDPSSDHDNNITPTTGEDKL